MLDINTFYWASAIAAAWFFAYYYAKVAKSYEHALFRIQQDGNGTPFTDKYGFYHVAWTRKVPTETMKIDESVVVILNPDDPLRKKRIQ